MCLTETYSYEYYGAFDHWSTDYFYLRSLGTAFDIETCFQLAVHANVGYFLLYHQQCLTSWALPYFIRERFREAFSFYKYLTRVYSINSELFLVVS